MDERREGVDAHRTSRRADGIRVFTWGINGLPDDDPRRTYVEFTLAPTGSGTRLTVIESGFAQLPEDSYRKAFDGNTDGWASELGELVEYLDANAA